MGATNEIELKKKTDIVLNRLTNAGMTTNEKNAQITVVKYHF